MSVQEYPLRKKRQFHFMNSDGLEYNNSSNSAIAVHLKPR